MLPPLTIVGCEFEYVDHIDAQSPRNASRDRDMEAVWCSEFQRLRTLVSASGGGLEIEQALPVGAMPLKLVEDPTNPGRDSTYRSGKPVQTTGTTSHARCLRFTAALWEA
jgi:hypothetical protein